jgi:molybdopterin converting factor small subunit
MGPTITIELFGPLRLRAARSHVTVNAGTLGAALEALACACPALSCVVDGGKLTPAYLVALNGKHFTDDEDRALTEGDVLVLVSAQAGG